MDLKSIQRINLDTVRNQYRKIYVKRNDVASRCVIIQITDSGATFFVDKDKVVRAKIRTPDNRLISLLSYDTDVSPKHIEILDDGTLFLTLSTGTIIEPGEATCEIEMKDSGGTILSTFSFTIVISELVFDDSELLDDSEVKSAVAQLIAELNEHAKVAKDYYDKVKDYTDDAKNYYLKSQSYSDGTAKNDDGSDYRIGQDKDNSKYWSEQSKSYNDIGKSWAIGNDSEHKRTGETGENNQSAQYYADKAKLYKNDAETSEDNAEDFSLKAQSYANGEAKKDDGSDYRDGQDKDNAKYYSEQSKSYIDDSKSWSIGNDSEHKRTGETGEDNQSAQYYAEKSKTYIDDSKSWAIGDKADFTRNDGSGENNQSAEYYAEKSKSYITDSKGWAIGDITSSDNYSSTNNAKYYSEKAKEYKDQAASIAGGNFATVDPVTGLLVDGQIPIMTKQEVIDLFKDDNFLSDYD